jgi:release factor glutamine methyltransferase
MDAPARDDSAARRGGDDPTAPWTTRRLLRWIDGHLAQKGVDSPRVCAEMLVGHVIRAERMRLYMEADRPASADELERLRALVQRAARHEPVQYLVGKAVFWCRDFDVGPATLIPRAATEHAVEECVAAARAAAERGSVPVRVLEIGTGTGCITVCTALGLSGERRTAEPGDPKRAVDTAFVATDLVPAALDLARANAAAHGMAARIDFRAGSLWAPLRADERGTFDVLVSNPPYVADDEWDEMAPNVRDHEPRTALAGGAQGMDVLAPLIAGAHEWLRPAGRLVVEIGHRQRDAVLAAARANPALAGADVRKDFEGFWRLLVADRR